MLSLQGIDDTPVFKRTRISNQTEQVSMVMSEAPYLDRETVLRKLPNIAPSEVQAIKERLDAEDEDRMGALVNIGKPGGGEDDEDEDDDEGEGKGRIK